MRLSEWARAVLLSGPVMVRQRAISAELASVSPLEMVEVTEAFPSRRSKGSRRVQGA
jgi:hypothetical protein